MKTFKKLLIIGFSYYIIIFLAGCFSCKCPKSYFKSYESLAFKVDALEYGPLSDTASVFPQPISGDTANALEFGLELKFDIEKFAFQEQHNHFSFLPEANACDCAERLLTPKDTISNIQVVTLNDFDVLHPAGTEIDDLFFFLDKDYNPELLVYTPLTAVSERASRYYVAENGGRLGIVVYLKATPETPRFVKFQLVVNYTNGKSLTALSREMYLR